MKAFKIILLSIFGVIDVYTIYSTIGYIILGGQSPRLVGDVTTVSMGMYMLAIVFGIVSIIISIAIILIACNLSKKRKGK
jgi:hypothetical protein